MSDWQQIIKDGSIATLEKLADKFGHDVIDVEALKPAFDNFQMRITPAALEQIKEVGDPMWNQYIPSVEELEVVDGVIDSLDEDGDSPVPNITHRYPDRALFLVSPVCATYCRFCTRRRKVGDPEKIPLNQYDSAFEYLRQHTEIRDVIMSGGDPMMLSDRRLEYLFQQLRAIPHIEIIRLGSRITSHLPERITPEFIQALRGWTSGLAVPQFVIDAPGGGGKVPLLPEYVEEINDDEVVFRNYEGKRFTYKQPRQLTVVGAEPEAESDIVPIRRGKKKE